VNGDIRVENGGPIAPAVVSSTPQPPPPPPAPPAPPQQ
jgi:hypothetical protein